MEKDISELDNKELEELLRNTPEHRRELIRGVWENHKLMYQYLSANNIPTELENEEKPFVVLILKEEEELFLQNVGQNLQKWKLHQPNVKRILGLENLLAGKMPEIASALLMIPIWSDPESWVSKVGLITINENLDETEIKRLYESLDTFNSSIHIYSWEGYSYLNR